MYCVVKYAYIYSTVRHVSYYEKIHTQLQELLDSNCIKDMKVKVFSLFKLIRQKNAAWFFETRKDKVVFLEDS